MFSELLIDGAVRGAAAAARSPRLLVLTYHRVLPRRDPMLSLEPDAGTFARQMEFAARHLVPCPLPEAVDRLLSGRLLPRSVCITFDDGYANNRHVALPILQRLGVPASFFIATGYLDGGCMWNDQITETFRRCELPAVNLTTIDLGTWPLPDLPARRRAARELIARLKYQPDGSRREIVRQVAELAGVDVPRDLMLTTREVRELHDAGMDVGGHTVTHPILANLADEVAAREIMEGRDRLADILGTAPRSFAYPNGQPGTDFQPRHAAMVKAAGYEFALSTIKGSAGRESDRWQLPRLTVWSATPARLAANLLPRLIAA